MPTKTSPPPSRLQALVTRLTNWPAVALIPAAVVFNLAVAVVFVYLLTTLFQAQGITAAPSFGSFDRDQLPLLTRVLTYGLVGPFLETLVQQHLVVKLLGPRLRLGATVLVSMLVFGLFHWQSLAYMTYGFLHGFAYVVLYVVCQRQRVWSPLLHVTLAHALFNLLVL
ncbi:CPBP family intramembrane glutamic endopeptidase [Hymenobacter arizonensis]|uniref:CAAX protease self-immunity n=1 Tax=Hymenobacter arizonensis TaxID=1227077 RepID=A0A1I6BSP5_HYMAR|nr:CPBP family intramembrane glutamic endopeptidase [Hymenobacter arizonensis]SFQ83968.1 CAAX protease self-immunity [Hymenobacter arizonensis]